MASAISDGWEPHMRACATPNGYRYWNDADLVALRHAWDTATSLPDPAANCSEPQMAR